MILEDATKEAYGYYSRDLKPKSGKPILAACDGCGKIRKLPKYNYNPFCNSCIQKKEKIKCICLQCGKEFKEYIRAKFAYKCFLCPTTQAENGKKLAVHHVNYNKDCGCDGDKTCQFVPLCASCHSKTNGNRDHWQKILMDKLHTMIIGWGV